MPTSLSKLTVETFSNPLGREPSKIFLRFQSVFLPVDDRDDIFLGSKRARRVKIRSPTVQKKEILFDSNFCGSGHTSAVKFVVEK